MTEIIKESYSELYLVSLDGAYAWKNKENTSKWETICYLGKLPGGTKVCHASGKDLQFFQSYALS